MVISMMLVSLNHLEECLVWVYSCLLHYRCCSTDGTAMSASMQGKSGVWYPGEALKGEKPVAESVRVMCLFHRCQF